MAPGSGCSSGAGGAAEGACAEAADVVFRLVDFFGFAIGLALVVTVTAGSSTTPLEAVPDADGAAVCAATGALLTISAAAATLYATDTLTDTPPNTQYGCYNIH